MFIYFLGVLVRTCPILRFRVLFIFFWFLGVCPILVVLVMSLGSCSVLILFVALWIYLSSFSGRKSRRALDNVSDSVNRGTSTARGTHASLYNWIVYKQGSKARERKGEERKHRLKLYTIIWSRDGNLPSRDGKLQQSDGSLPVP